MSRSSIRTGLGLAIVLQFFVLSGMVVRAAMPLWTGVEIRVKTTPVDPRSMFRGNYARLSHEISQLPKGALKDVDGVRFGEIVYVTLQPDDQGVYRLASASLEKPGTGVFLRGRIASDHQPYRMKYGIEAFFAPKAKALQLEKDLRTGGISVLMVDRGGRAALKTVVPDAAPNPAAPD